MESKLKRILFALLLVLAAVLSFFVLSGLTGKLEAALGVADNLDAKADTVLKLTVSSTLLSAAISSPPSKPLCKTRWSAERSARRTAARSSRK